MLEKFLAIEKFRFEKGFNYIIEAKDDADIESLRIPPMLIQPFAENAIKHGLFHSPDDKFLSIMFSRQNEYLICEIKDNGIGRTAAKKIQMERSRFHQSFSLNATTERIDLFNTDRDKKIKFEIKDLFSPYGKPSGTLVTIYIPADL